MAPGPALLARRSKSRGRLGLACLAALSSVRRIPRRMSATRRRRIAESTSMTRRGTSSGSDASEPAAGAELFISSQRWPVVVSPGGLGAIASVCAPLNHSGSWRHGAWEAAHDSTSPNNKRRPGASRQRDPSKLGASRQSELAGSAAVGRSALLGPRPARGGPFVATGRGGGSAASDGDGHSDRSAGVR